MRLLELFRGRTSTGRAPLVAAQVLRALAVAGICARFGPAFAEDAAQNQGQQIFMSSGCFVCHGQMGTGGAGPSFRNDPFLSVTDYVVAQILLGRGTMPAFGEALNDQEVAAVASYIRNSWGNHFGTVDPQEVARVRKQFQSMNVTAMGPPPPASGTPATAK